MGHVLISKSIMMTLLGQVWITLPSLELGLESALCELNELGERERDKWCPQKEVDSVIRRDSGRLKMADGHKLHNTVSGLAMAVGRGDRSEYLSRPLICFKKSISVLFPCFIGL